VVPDVISILAAGLELTQNGHWEPSDRNFHGKSVPRGRKGVIFDAFSSAEHGSSVRIGNLLVRI
jgi:hypothetical protein